MRLLLQRPVAALLTALPALIPPLCVVGWGAVSLHTLRGGLAGGLIVLALALPLVAIAFWAFPGTPVLVIAYALTMAPCLAAGEVLRRTVSLPLALFTLTAFCLVGVLAFYVAVADPVAFWRAYVDAAMEAAVAAGSVSGSTADLDALRERFPYSSFTGIVAGGALISYVAALLLGRWWQAQSVNPGGFRKEFHELRMGRTAGLASGAVFIAAAVVPSVALLNFAVVFLILWGVQGLAVIHGLVGIAGAPRLLLLAVYVVIVASYFTGNPILVLVPLLGLVDPFLDLRTKLKNRKG